MADPPEPFWRTRYYALEVMTKPGRRARSSVNDANGMGCDRGHGMETAVAGS
jgi:hypothetical protein